MELSQEQVVFVWTSSSGQDHLQAKQIYSFLNSKPIILCSIKCGTGNPTNNMWSLRINVLKIVINNKKELVNKQFDQCRLQ